MGILTVESLQSEAMEVENRGSGYSRYADLNEAEKKVLTLVDAINVGLGAFPLSQDDRAKYISQKEEALKSEEWLSAALKMSKNPKVVDFVKNWYKK